MNRKFLQHIILSILLLSAFACSGTKYLSEKDSLARNGKVKIEGKKNIRQTSDLRISLSKLAEVKQNNKLFWMRPRLSIHNTIKEPEKDKGFRYWMKYKLGTPPVIYSANKTEMVRQAMEDYMFHSSYFNSQVSFNVSEKKNQKKPFFIVRPGASYTISSLAYLKTGTDIDSEIESILAETNKQNTVSRYSLESVIEKRKELAFALMNDGYYYFRPDYFEFIADTSASDTTIELQLRLKENTPEEAFSRYRISNVIVEDNFYIDSVYEVDTLLINKVFYLSPENYIKPKVVVNAIHIRPDSLYNRDVHLKTLSHLRALEVYKFVNILYNKDDSISDRLNARLLLVPLSKMSFSGELNANVKSNNFAGPGVLFSFSNRNTFKGAEVFNLSFGGRFETQIGQNLQGNTSYELRVDANLKLPRLYPFKSKVVKSRNVPTTGINLGGGLQERVGWYQMVNWNTSLRYSWRVSEKITQRFSPVDINLSSLLNTSEQFDDYLKANPSVQRSFEEQFVLGMNYNFYYSKSSDRFNTPFFIGLTLDFSGNMLSAIIKATGQKDPSPEDPYKILNTPYSQYIRSIIDIRKKLKLWPKNSIATRLIIAGGVPYSNSDIMPYIKQFYVGGANSLRGFLARSVGPGTYKYDYSSSGFIDQAGDLKFEVNFEYRFPIWGILHSALFTDIGNIWLVNEDETRPGGKFEFNDFASELAVSSGIGLRIEINPIIIRFDWAWPMRFPYEVDGNNWVVNKIDFSNSTWRKDNLILNISLGYPF